MSAAAFVDTNILLYAISAAPNEGAKRTIAREVLVREDIGFSCQVFQEFYVNAVRGKNASISHDEAVAFVNVLSAWPVVDTTIALVERAFALCVKYQLSYWDAAIVAAAQDLRCTTLLSEDFQHGRDFDGLVVENPFR